ncbi:MAG: HAD-IC family P-type ATPase, partial [Chloroflexi bacterium]|nr:HAD-IC family P-type ATPase [Chloroflexota bacterium]
AFSRRNGDGHVSDDLARQVREAEAQGYTVVLVEDACCNQSCYLAIADTLRPEAAGAVRGVKDAGVAHTVMLTGDNPHIAAQIAETAGVDDFYASLLPEDKVTAIERLEAERGRTAMVGDGVNDAPAMAKATVGIAMGAAGTDTALETADVALMGDDLSRLPYALRLSRSALAVVRQNVAASLAIKAVFLGLAIAGISTLWMAVLADTGASILVTLNGMRMLRYRE